MDADGRAQSDMTQTHVYAKLEMDTRSNSGGACCGPTSESASLKLVSFTVSCEPSCRHLAHSELRPLPRSNWDIT